MPYSLQAAEPTATPGTSKTRRTMKPLKIPLCLALACTSLLHAQGAPAESDPRQTYQRDVAACRAAAPTTDSAACLKEARNTLAEVRRGHLDASPDARQLARNALVRCEVHQGDDRADCIARIQGQGTVQGSVEGGGLLRSLRTELPAQ